MAQMNAEAADRKENGDSGPAKSCRKCKIERFIHIVSVKPSSPRQCVESKSCLQAVESKNRKNRHAAEIIQKVDVRIVLPHRKAVAISR